MTYRQQEIVLLPFPYSDLSSSKKRPALVISNNDFNEYSDDIICCLITTNPEKQKYKISISDTDVEEGMLNFKSFVKPFRLFTVDKKIVLKKLCKLKKSRFNEVMDKLQKIISKA